MLVVFVPALLIAGIAVIIRVIQYEPLYPTVTPKTPTGTALPIPIFSEDPILGNKKAPTTIIAFEDLGCEACKLQMDILQQLLELYPEKLKLIWKGLPTTRIPYPSDVAHRYAYCAHQQEKFVPFIKAAFAIAPNLSSTALEEIVTIVDMDKKRLTSCLESGTAETYLQNTADVAKALGVQAVPAFFVNNTQVTAPTTLGGWKQLLQLE